MPRRRSSTPTRASAQLTGNIVFPGFTAPKLVWVKNNEPDDFRAGAQGAAAEGLSAAVADRRAHFGNVRLGRHVLARCRRGARWSPELLAATFLDEQQMPSLVEGTAARPARCAPNSPAKWGMGRKRRRSPAAPATMRPRPAAWARSSRAHAFVSLGTSGVLFAANASYLPNPQSAVHTFCHALPDTWHQMGVILSATDSLNWLSGMTGQGGRRTDRRTRRRAEGAGRRVLPALSLGRAHAAQ